MLGGLFGDLLCKLFGIGCPKPPTLAEKEKAKNMCDNINRKVNEQRQVGT